MIEGREAASSRMAEQNLACRRCAEVYAPSGMRITARKTVAAAAAMTLSGCVSVTGNDEVDAGRNHPPRIEEQTSWATAPEGQPLAIMVHAYDLDGDPLAVSVEAWNPEAAYQIEPVETIVDGVNHLVMQLSIEPPQDYSGTGSVHIEVSDAEASSSAPVYYRLDRVNDPPIARDDLYAVPLGTPLEIAAPNLLANDDDAADVFGGLPPPAQFSIAPELGLAVAGVGDAIGGIVSLVGETIRFVPDAGFAGTAAFRYTITDGEDTADATVRVAVGGVNTAPAATDDEVNLVECWGCYVHPSLLVANDSDLEGHSVAVVAVANVAGGSAEMTEGYVRVEFHGDQMELDYTVTDGTSTSTAHARLRNFVWLSGKGP